MIIGQWINNAGYSVIKTHDGKLHLEHRYIVQNIMGIRLSKDVVVHHKDHNKLNNIPSNLYPCTINQHNNEE